MPQTTYDNRTGKRGLIEIGVTAAAGVLLCLGTAAAVAQQPGIADARACASIADEAERLDCYDRAVRAGQGEAGDAVETTRSATETRSTSTNRRSEESRSTEAGERPAGSRDDDGSSRTSRSTASRSAPGRAPEGANESEPSTMPVTIIEIPRTRPSAVFVTESGEVWVQTDGRRFNMPDPPFEAELRPGALGSWFLAATEGGRAVRVTQR